jgi:hypothetical protein
MINSKQLRVPPDDPLRLRGLGCALPFLLLSCTFHCTRRTDKHTGTVIRVIVKPRQWGGHGPLRAVAPQETKWYRGKSRHFADVRNIAHGNVSTRWCWILVKPHVNMQHRWQHSAKGRCDVSTLMSHVTRFPCRYVPDCFKHLDKSWGKKAYKT